MKHYWENREIGSNKAGNLVKRSRLMRQAANVFFSVRASDEAFLAQSLVRRRVHSILDVACGSGKAVLPAIADYVAGVDITGYPAGAAYAKGYADCVSYEPPNYDFAIDRQVDAITAINLNAHLPKESYETVLRRSMEFLRPGGILILIHELDNEGVSYRWMHRNERKFRRFVEGMEHWYLANERATLESIQGALCNMKLLKRYPLTGSLLPSIHYYAYATERDPGPVLKKLFILTDIPISVVNYLQCRLKKGINKSFLVGYIYEKAA